MFRLTGRGAIVALFLLCFLSLLTGWSVLADAAFVCGCGVVTYYTKFAGLRTVVVSPPLVFLAGCICAKAVTSSGRSAWPRDPGHARHVGALAVHRDGPHRRDRPRPGIPTRDPAAGQAPR